MKISRAFWQEVIDKLPEGMLLCDSEGRFQLWNRRAQQLLERLSKEEKVQFNSVQDIFKTVEDAEGTKPIKEWLQEALNRKRECEGHAWLDTAPKEKLALRLKAIPLTPSGARGVQPSRRQPAHADILILLSEEPAAADTPAFTEDAASLSPAQVIAWTASVAHEIRNPLSAIGNCIEILDKQLNLQGDSKELVMIALSECERLDRVLANLLTLARRREPQRQWVEIHELVERVCTALQYDTRFQPMIELKRDFGAPPAQVLWIDRDQISQMLWNLLINAVHAMPNGGALWVVTRLTEGGWFRLSVRDTGIGMSREVIEKAGQPFFTTKVSGTGLGLATAKAIVLQHGGRFLIESEEGRGTQVTVLLPLSSDA
ncbi:MAG: ATP-binding protein [Abditibacteriales bacterium]|nr:ATP-binding protein [Abditibacteriales bacterium]MDW8365056.1 ATP-binding protein [Abditibacteriales bacterium]